jgi:hypothetical protein
MECDGKANGDPLIHGKLSGGMTLSMPPKESLVFDPENEKNS